jgi:hypothetical protein
MLILSLLLKVTRRPCLDPCDDIQLYRSNSSMMFIGNQFIQKLRSHTDCIHQPLKTFLFSGEAGCQELITSRVIIIIICHQARPLEFLCSKIFLMGVQALFFLLDSDIWLSLGSCSLKFNVRGETNYLYILGVLILNIWVRVLVSLWPNIIFALH